MPSSRRTLLAGAGALAVGTTPAAAHWEDSGDEGPRRGGHEATRCGGHGARPWNRSDRREVLLAGLAGDSYRGWVAGVDAGGRERQHRLLGVARTAFFAAVRTPGGVLLAGLTNETLRPSRPNTPDPYAVHVRTDGDIAWARTYQPAVPEGETRSVVPTNDGQVVAGDACDGESARP